MDENKRTQYAQGRDVVCFRENYVVTRLTETDEIAMSLGANVSLVFTNGLLNRRGFAVYVDVRNGGFKDNFGRGTDRTA